MHVAKKNFLSKMHEKFECMLTFIFRIIRVCG